MEGMTWRKLLDLLLVTWALLAVAIMVVYALFGRQLAAFGRWESHQEWLQLLLLVAIIQVTVRLFRWAVEAGEEIRKTGARNR